MREDRPSALRAALRLVVEGVRRRGEGADFGSSPRRRPAVERRALAADPAGVRRFLRATGGEQTTEAAALPHLPPTYAAVWETALALELLPETGIPLPPRGLVHLESELLRIRPLPLGEPVRCRVELDRLEPHRRGARMLLKARCWTASGQLCQESTLGLLVVTAAPPRLADDSHAPADPARPGSDSDSWNRVADWSLAPRDARRYARASGDYNPIHLWGWSARLAGFRRPLLHGYCLQSMVAHALIRERWGGDARALRRLRIAFRAPLLLPAGVRLVATSDTGGAGRFQVIDARREPGAAGEPYAEGEYVGGVP